jgi:hypothetical protein
VDYAGDTNARESERGCETGDPTPDYKACFWHVVGGSVRPVGDAEGISMNDSFSGRWERYKRRWR